MTERMSAHRADLFHPDTWPAGFRYAPDFLDTAEEERLIRAVEPLAFAPFEFQGFVGNRRVISFGWRYDFNGGGLQQAEDIPAFLLPLRKAAGGLFGIDPAKLEQVLLTQYPPGAAIGWHKDRSVFEDVIGVSLLSSCTFRFRRKAGAKWERCALVVEARSAYLLQGEARTAWQHSIPAVESLRYSITFRSFRAVARASDPGRRKSRSRDPRDRATQE